MVSAYQNAKPRVIALNSFTNDFFNSLYIVEKLPEFTFFYSKEVIFSIWGKSIAEIIFQIIAVFVHCSRAKLTQW